MQPHLTEQPADFLFLLWLSAEPGWVGSDRGLPVSLWRVAVCRKQSGTGSQQPQGLTDAGVLKGCRVDDSSQFLISFLSLSILYSGPTGLETVWRCRHLLPSTGMTNVVKLETVIYVSLVRPRSRLSSLGTCPLVC